MDLAKINTDLDADEKALREHLTQLQAGVQDAIGKLNQIAGARAVIAKLATPENQPTGRIAKLPKSEK